MKRQLIIASNKTLVPRAFYATLGLSMKKLFLYSTLLLSPLAYTQDIVAVLDLMFVKETEDAAAWMCYGENNDNCYP